jgi:phosphate transport system protein
MRNAYFQAIDSLLAEFQEMGEFVHESMERTIESIRNHDTELAKDIMRDDEKVNDYERSLEKQSIELIALQQPVTKDLRRIITVVKAVADVERIGDHLVGINEAIMRGKITKRNQEMEDILLEMGQDVSGMMEDVLIAYEEDDTEAAYEIAERDNQVNENHYKIHQLAASLTNEEVDPTSILEYVLISTYYERIGDYITNISEWIVYLETGELIEINSKNKKNKLI